MYEYQCSQCGDVKDKFFKMADKANEILEDCGCSEEKTTHISIMSAVAMSYNGFNHVSKVPTDMRNRLDQIKKHYPDMQSTV